jgi:hypothetical protein
VQEVLNSIKSAAKKGNAAAKQFLTYHYSGASDGEDKSGADMSYMNIAAFYSGNNPDVMRLLILDSALMREKLNRVDYLDRTINKAISSCKGSFKPNTQLNTHPDQANPADTGSTGDSLSYDEIKDLINQLDEDNPDLEKAEEILLATVGLNNPLRQSQIMKMLKTKAGFNMSDMRDMIKQSSESDSEEADHLSLALEIINAIGRDNILNDKNFTWAWNDAGVWQVLEDRHIKQQVQRLISAKVKAVTKNKVDGVTDLFKNELFAHNHKWNIGGAEMVNCLNGEVVMNDRHEWELIPHNKNHYRTTQIKVNFNPDATAPKFMSFLDSVFVGDEDSQEKKLAILELIGYSLMAHARHEKFCVLVGSGANGKSVLLRIISELLGREQVAGVQPDQFDNKYQRAHLGGKLANIVTEIK